MVKLKASPGYSYSSVSSSVTVKTGQRGKSKIVSNFAKWLYERRKRAGLTQEALGELAGCKKGYVSKLERQVPHSTSNALPLPSLEMVDAFARALGVSRAEARFMAFVADVMAPADQKTIGADLLRERLTFNYEKLDAQDKKTLIHLSDALTTKHILSGALAPEAAKALGIPTTTKVKSK